MKRRHMIGIILVLVFIIITGVGLASSLTPYIAFDEAKLKDKTVQVHGTLESAVRTLDAEQGISFNLKDENGTVAEVVYKGLKPENMEHSEGVVVVGKFDGDIFRADSILVKCPSKYESQVEGGSQ